MLQSTMQFVLSPSIGNSLSSDNRPFGDDTDQYANRVADKICPEKSKPQNQPAQCGLPDRVYPRGMVELANLHYKGER